MELPDLGQNCQVKTCNQLDFLPVKCDACSCKFCNAHWTYDAHECPQRHTKNVQVPVCPLCDKPVPTAKGTSPDATVSAHLDRDCRESAKRKIKNRCSVRKCKQTEFIKVECDQCKQNFCLKHRHPTDHQCQGKPSPSAATGSASSRAAQAALARQQQQRQQQQQQTTAGLTAAIRSTASNTSNRIANMFQQQQLQQQQPVGNSRQTVNGQLSEDEALARALQASINESHPSGEQQSTAGGASGLRAPTTREEQDRMLAQALAESERAANRTTSNNSNNKSCGIS